jgi:hypothetical protein
MFNASTARRYSQPLGYRKFRASRAGLGGPSPYHQIEKTAYGESTDAAGTIAFPRRLLRPELMGRQVATPSPPWAGRVNWKLAPRGTVAAAHTRPPCASMIERQIDSPMPIPPGLVV